LKVKEWLEHYVETLPWVCYCDASDGLEFVLVHPDDLLEIPEEDDLTVLVNKDDNACVLFNKDDPIALALCPTHLHTFDEWLDQKVKEDNEDTDKGRTG